jgi:tetratricopeptide (TPR) repeat protein
MRFTAVAGGLLVLAVAVWVTPRNPGDGLRGDPAGARVLMGSIGFFESKLAADSIDASAAGALASRYVLRFQRSADLDDLRRAENVIERTLPYHADAASALAQLSAVRLMQHDFAGAYQAATAAASRSTPTVEALGAWFDAALATGRWDEAAKALAAMDVRSLGTRVRSSHWKDANGDSEGAYRTLSDVCDQLERSGGRPETAAWCFTELAGLALANAQDRDATRLYEKALRIMAGYRGAIEGLADHSHFRGDWKTAVERYESIAVDAHPDLYLRLAEAERGLGREARAVAWEAEFMRVAGASRVEHLYAHPLAIFLAGIPDERDRALAIARRDVESRPASESWDVLAWVHLLRGELVQALSASDRAVARAPTPTMLYRRARIMDALGRHDSATVLLQAATGNRSQMDPAARVDLDRFIARK